MSIQNSSWTIAFIMFLSGIGIAILATWNGALGNQLGSPAGATFVLFGVGFVISGMIVLASGIPPASAFTFDRP